jgi:ribosome biogenesis protein MAK21
LVNHGHPTIALLARQILDQEPLTSSPDLTLYTLTHFLDRFVYKNPKKAGARGSSAMQPSTAGGVGGVSRVRADVQETPLNVEGWWRRGESGVAPDQVCCHFAKKTCHDAQIFFQRYFAQKHGKEQVKAAKVDKRKATHHDSDTKSDGTVEDGSDEDSDPEEATIWKVRLTGIVKPVLLIEPIQAMKASLPKAEEDEDGEDVDDDDDVDDEDDSQVDHSIQDSESDEHASSDTDTEEDEDASSDAEDDINVKWEFDSVGSSGVDGSVNPDALWTPIETYSYDQAGSDRQSPALSGGKTRKRKGRGDDDDRTRKKKLRALPTFASYEDYAQMIEDGPEEN